MWKTLPSPSKHCSSNFKYTSHCAALSSPHGQSRDLWQTFAHPPMQQTLADNLCLTKWPWDILSIGYSIKPVFLQPSEGILTDIFCFCQNPLGLSRGWGRAAHWLLQRSPWVCLQAWGWCCTLNGAKFLKVNTFSFHDVKVICKPLLASTLYEHDESKLKCMYLAMVK